MTLHFGWLIVGVIVYLTLLLGILAVTGKIPSGKQGSEFFLARDGKRGLHPLLLLISYAATVYSAFTVVGMPGFIYGRGVGAYGFIVIAQLLQVACILLFGFPLWKKAQQIPGATSPIEVVSSCYRSPRLGVALTIATVIFVIPHVALQLAAMGKLLSGVTNGGIHYSLGVGTILVVMILYSEFGGFRGVVLTDVIQFALILVGVVALAVVFLLQYFGGSFTTLFEQLRNSDNSSLLATPGPTGFYTTPMLISNCLFIGLWPIGHPSFSVRFLAQSRPIGLKYLVVGMAFLPAIMFLPALIIGLGGAVIFPDLDSPDLIAGQVLSGVMSHGGPAMMVLGFLFVIAALAGAMSTCDSQALAMGQIFSRDVIRGVVAPKISPKREILCARTAIVAVFLTSYFVGMIKLDFINKLGVLSGMGTAVLVPTYLGIRLKCPSPYAAFASLIGGYTILLLGETKVMPNNMVLGFHNGATAIVAAAVIYCIISPITNHHANSVKSPSL